MLLPFISLSEANISAKSNFKEAKEVNGVLMVEFDSIQEEEKFLSELEKQNAYSLSLWEKAVENSDDGIITETAQQSAEPNQIITPTAHASNTVGTTFLVGLNLVSLASNVSYDKVNNRFGTIYNLSLYSRHSSDTVSNTTLKRTTIDDRRTLAVTATYRLGIKSSSGSVSYYSVYSYYEFYASSNGGKWFTNNYQY